MCPMDVYAAQLCEAPQKLAALSSVLQSALHLPRNMVRHAGNCLHRHRPDPPRMLEFGCRMLVQVSEVYVCIPAEGV